MRIGLSYDDVCLIPKYNNIESRTHTDLRTQLTTNYQINIPIVAANMDTVIGPELAKIMDRQGSAPIFHRFYKDEDQKQLIDLVKAHNGACFMSWGINDLDKLIRLVEDNKLNPVGFCLDIAHGHSKTMFKAIEDLRNWSHFEIIAGNVCTAEAFAELANAGATAVKVGIGPGAVCTTRKVTGFGVPQFTAVQDCAKRAKELQVPLIADGGIKSSRDIVLALAAGASSVMVGRLFANTKEAAGKGFYRGQASESFQKSFYGDVKQDTAPEGISTVVAKDDELVDASKVLNDLLGGLRSGLTYGGASSIAELQRKAEFMRVTENY